jgi:hypothetical protein
MDITTRPTLTFNDELLTAEIRRYINPDNIAIQLWSKDGPYATASVNLPDKLPDGLVAIKDWSENWWVLEALINAGIISEPVDYYLCGFEAAPICQLLVGQERS